MSERLEARRQSRREAMIRAAAATLAATGLGSAGVVFAANPVAQTPGETEGPYWLDSMPERSNLKTDTSSGTAYTGFPLRLSLNISRLASDVVTPVGGAKVDIWHANAAGKYSGFASEGTTGANFLRGYQLTDAHGNVSFETIYPGWYSGRTPHVHFRVRLLSGATVTYNFVSQFFFTEAYTNLVYNTAAYGGRGTRNTTNATDGIYTGPSQGNGGTVASNSGAYLMLRPAQNSSRAIGLFNIVL